VKIVATQTSIPLLERDQVGMTDIQRGFSQFGFFMAVPAIIDPSERNAAAPVFVMTGDARLRADFFSGLCETGF